MSCLDINYYAIQSRLGYQLLLSVEDGQACSGKRVVTYPLKKDWNFWGSQLWCDDHKTRSIRSKENGHCLDESGTLAKLCTVYTPLLY